MRSPLNRNPRPRKCPHSPKNDLRQSLPLKKCWYLPKQSQRQIMNQNLLRHHPLRRQSLTRSLVIWFVCQASSGWSAKARREHP